MAESPDLAAAVHRALEQSIRERGQVNVLIAGRTGVGKSTLINSVFQGRLAETGQGRPVTQTTREIKKEGIPLAIWDTRGLEMSAFQETIDELTQLIADRAKEPDFRRHIHVSWLCIHEDGRRVEDAEIALHRALARYMPVLGVITKARGDQGFRAEVQRLLPETRNVVRVRALAEVLDGGHALPQMGLVDLVELTAEVIPEGLRRALAAAQKASVRQKKIVAHGVVGVSATAAAAAGATPIPFSDAVILVPVQISMLAGISSAFGLELSTAFLSVLVASAAGTTGNTFAGRAIVANLLKFIPGAGTIAGGAVSAATAATLTTTLGELYIATLVAAFTEAGGDTPEPGAVAREFKRRLKRLTGGTTGP
jgi:uncharacterized protein (DUF697 family)